jgi:hypothetical protein
MDSSDNYFPEYLRRINVNQLGAPTIYDGTSSTILWASDLNVSGWGYGQPSWWQVNAAAAAPVNCFRASGQWLFAWVAGWLGAAIAVMLRRRSESELD